MLSRRGQSLVNVLIQDSTVAVLRADILQRVIVVLEVKEPSLVIRRDALNLLIYNLYIAIYLTVIAYLTMLV
jgi:hypothetical protein